MDLLGTKFKGMSTIDPDESPQLPVYLDLFLFLFPGMFVCNKTLQISPPSPTIRKRQLGICWSLFHYLLSQRFLPGEKRKDFKGIKKSPDLFSCTWTTWQVFRYKILESI